MGKSQDLHINSQLISAPMNLLILQYFLHHLSIYFPRSPRHEPVDSAKHPQFGGKVLLGKPLGLPPRFEVQFQISVHHVYRPHLSSPTQCHEVCSLRLHLAALEQIHLDAPVLGQICRVVEQESFKMWNIAILGEELVEKMAQFGRNGVDLGVRVKKRRIFLVSNQSEHINKLLVIVEARYFRLFELRMELVFEVEVGLGHVGVWAPITTIDQLQPVPVGLVVLP